MRKVEGLKGIFRAARSDYEGGYLFKITSVISGEIYGDFVGLARAALDEGHKNVSAVLACAALEDALKRYALAHGLDVSTQDMERVINALKSKGLVEGAMKSILDRMPKIRDRAMHAEWDKISSEEVGSVLGFVQQFLQSKFV